MKTKKLTSLLLCIALLFQVGCSLDVQPNPIMEQTGSLVITNDNKSFSVTNIPLVHRRVDFEVGSVIDIKRQEDSGALNYFVVKLTSGFVFAQVGTALKRHEKFHVEFEHGNNYWEVIVATGDDADYSVEFKDTKTVLVTVLAGKVRVFLNGDEYCRMSKGNYIELKLDIESVQGGNVIQKGESISKGMLDNMEFEAIIPYLKKHNSKEYDKLVDAILKAAEIEEPHDDDYVHPQDGVAQFEVESSQKQLEQKDREIEELKKRVEVLETEVSPTECEEWKELYSEALSVLKEIEETIDLINKAQSLGIHDEDKISQKVDKALKNLEESMETVSNLKTEIGNHQEELRATYDNLDKAITERQDLARELREKETEFARILEEQAENHQNEIDKLNEKLIHESGKSAEIEGELAELKYALAAAESFHSAELERVEGLLDERNAENERLNLMLEQKKAYIIILEVENSTLRADNAALEDRNAAVEGKNAALENENATLKEENAVLKEENAVLKDEVVRLESANAELERLQSEINTALARINELESLIAFHANGKKKTLEKQSEPDNGLGEFPDMDTDTCGE